MAAPDMIDIVVQARIDRPEPVGQSTVRLVLPLSRHYAAKLENSPLEDDPDLNRLDLWVDTQVHHKLGAAWTVVKYRKHV